MVDVKIGKGQGITQAIKAKIQNDGGTIAPTVNESVWSQVMAEVKNAQDSNSVTSTVDGENKNYAYEGDGDATKINDRSTWATSFKVVKDQVIHFAESTWNKIVALLSGNPTKEDFKFDVPKAEDDKDINVDGLKEDKEEPEPKEEPHFEDLPSGAKVKLRDIVNVGQEGSKEAVVKTKENGAKVYHQAVTDPETGEMKMGQRLAVDRRGLRKDEYYTIDNTIPNGAEVDKKTVDGQKDILNYEIKENDGKTHRYLMVEDNGTYTKGDELIKIAGSNKFMSTTKLNDRISQTFKDPRLNLSVLKENGIDVQVINSAGEDYVIYKKDGRTINGSELSLAVKDIQIKLTNPEDVSESNI